MCLGMHREYLITGKVITEQFVLLNLSLGVKEELSSVGRGHAECREQISCVGVNVSNFLYFWQLHFP